MVKVQVRDSIGKYMHTGIEKERERDVRGAHLMNFSLSAIALRSSLIRSLHSRSSSAHTGWSVILSHVRAQIQVQEQEQVWIQGRVQVQEHKVVPAERPFEGEVMASGLLLFTSRSRSGLHGE
jgi:hypothetical protein